MSTSTLGFLALPLLSGSKNRPKRSAAETLWVSRASMPHEVQEIYCARKGNQIHVAGGLVANGEGLEVSSKHMVYKAAEDTWVLRAPLPEARHHLQLVALGERLFGLGGFAVRGPGAFWVMQNQTWEYLEDANGWEVREPAPETHGETVGAGLDGYIHLIGGRRPRGSSNRTWNDQADTDRHLVYDPVAHRWATAAPAPTPRNSAAGAVIDGLWYVTGGRQVNGGNLGILEIYDPREDRWRTAAPMPQGQGGLAAASAGGKLYAFGGEFFDSGGGVYKECWCYNPTDDSWGRTTPMKSPRHGLAGTAIGRDIYAIGGALQAGGNRTSKRVEMLRTD